MFTEFIPYLRRAHCATKRLRCGGGGCYVGASLLAVDLARSHVDAVYVTGCYAPLCDEPKIHAWVEVNRLVLDPTRDQFSGEDAFSEAFEGTYQCKRPRTGDLLVPAAYGALGDQYGGCEERKAKIENVAEQYGLDPAKLPESRTPPGVAPLYA